MDMETCMSTGMDTNIEIDMDIFLYRDALILGYSDIGVESNVESCTIRNRLRDLESNIIFSNIR
jgi:uncharacterized protein (DUF1499 family)